jgi:hypothetical protein
MAYEVRKWLTSLEAIEHDGGPRSAEPLYKVVAAAVVRNPFAGRYADDLSELVEPSPALGAELAARALQLLGSGVAEAYGKGALAGTAGEQEHAVACITTPFGDALRETIGGGAAWIPSATKVAGPGASLDVPVAYKDALYVRSHYDTVTFRVGDAPRPDELVIAVALTSGPRVHNRLGGLERDEAVGDGVR